MRNLIKMTLILSFTMCANSVGMVALHAEGAVCHKCEEIREYNKTHHKNYDYYEDYLKEVQEGGCTGPGCAPKTEESKSPAKPK